MKNLPKKYQQEYQIQPLRFEVPMRSEQLAKAGAALLALALIAAWMGK